MENMKILSQTMYANAFNGGSTTGNLVTVIGEQTVEYEGRILEQYIYNIKGHATQNGKPFAALKSNIFLFEC